MTRKRYDAIPFGLLIGMIVCCTVIGCNNMLGQSIDQSTPEAVYDGFSKAVQADDHTLAYRYMTPEFQQANAAVAIARIAWVYTLQGDETLEENLEKLFISHGISEDELENLSDPRQLMGASNDPAKFYGALADFISEREDEEWAFYADVGPKKSVEMEGESCTIMMDVGNEERRMILKKIEGKWMVDLIQMVDVDMSIP